MYYRANGADARAYRGVVVVEMDAGRFILLGSVG